MLTSQRLFLRAAGFAANQPTLRSMRAAQTSMVASLVKPIKLPVKFGVFGESLALTARNISSNAPIDDGLLALNSWPSALVKSTGTHHFYVKRCKSFTVY
jgi:hypothetical protein